MSVQRIVIIGAVALGPKVACRLKRLKPDWDVLMIDQDEHISYGGCGIPYYVSGDVSDEKELRTTSFHVTRDEHFFENAKGVNVRTATRATAGRLGRGRGAPAAAQAHDLAARGSGGARFLSGAGQGLPDAHQRGLAGLDGGRAAQGLTAAPVAGVGASGGDICGKMKRGRRARTSGGQGFHGEISVCVNADIGGDGHCAAGDLFCAQVAVHQRARGGKGIVAA